MMLPGSLLCGLLLLIVARIVASDFTASDDSDLMVFRTVGFSMTLCLSPD